jgi:hypothetical protein
MNNDPTDPSSETILSLNNDDYNIYNEPGSPIDLKKGDKIKAIRDIKEGAKNENRKTPYPYVHIPKDTVLTLIDDPKETMGVLQYKFSGLVGDKEYNDLRIMGTRRYNKKITTHDYIKISNGGSKRRRSRTLKRTHKRRSNKRSTKRKY